MSNKMLTDSNLVSGAVDVSLMIVLEDFNTGQLKVGVAHTDITCYYFRQSAATAVAISLSALGAVNSSHSDGGWIQIDSTNMPGLYRLDLTDAFQAAGADSVILYIKGGSIKTYIKEFAINTFTVDTNGRVAVQVGTSAGQLNTASGVIDANVTQCGGTSVAAGAIPNAVAGSTNGLPIVDSSGGVKVQDGTGAGQIDLSSGTVSVGAIANNLINSDVLDTTAVSEITTALWTSSPASETYSTNGVIPNLGQFLFQILQSHNEFVKSGTTITVKKLNHSDPAMTLTLDNASTPTSITRSS